jgi:hypothetical protein
LCVFVDLAAKAWPLQIGAHWSVTVPEIEVCPALAVPDPVIEQEGDAAALNEPAGKSIESERVPPDKVADIVPGKGRSGPSIPKIVLVPVTPDAPAVVVHVKPKHKSSPLPVLMVPPQLPTRSASVAGGPEGAVGDGGALESLQPAAVVAIIVAQTITTIRRLVIGHSPMQDLS